jgi:hypothetical protein
MSKNRKFQFETNMGQVRWALYIIPIDKLSNLDFGFITKAGFHFCTVEHSSFIKID